MSAASMTGYRALAAAVLDSARRDWLRLAASAYHRRHRARPPGHRSPRAYTAYRAYRRRLAGLRYVLTRRTIWHDLTGQTPYTVAQLNAAVTRASAVNLSQFPYQHRRHAA